MRDSRPKPTQATLTPEVGATDHVLGSPNAAITLVEYGDFECEFCGRAYPELKSLLKQVGHKVRFVFRHFPIPEEHPHAPHAARVRDDFLSGVRSGVSGTPRFFINGRPHEEPGDAKTLAAALRRAL